jgi:hypothetical protein
MKKILIFSILAIIIVVILGSILAYNYFKPNIINLDKIDQSILQGKDINNPVDLKSIINEVEKDNILPANPRIKIVYQGNEIAYLDHLGNIGGVSGWFTNLNASLTNSSIFYEAGNRLALNSSITDNVANWLSTYNSTYHNYVVANISNQTYNWITANNGTMNSINITWLDNVAGFLSFKLTQLETWFAGKLTDIYANINGNLTASKIYTNENIASNLTTVLLLNGSNTMTGDLNLGGKNITNVKNISFGGSNNIYDNGTCLKLQGSTSLLEIC